MSNNNYLREQEFLNLMQETRNKIAEIDAQTEWQNFEPNWWLDMMELDRKTMEIQNRHLKDTLE